MLFSRSYTAAELHSQSANRNEHIQNGRYKCNLVQELVRFIAGSPRKAKPIVSRLAFAQLGIGSQITGGAYERLTGKNNLGTDNVDDATGRILDRVSKGKDLFWAIRVDGRGSFEILLWLDATTLLATVTAFTVPNTLGQGVTILLCWWPEVFDKLDENSFLRVVIQASECD